MFIEMWNNAKAWVASKGGFAHIVAALYLLAIGAYVEVPAFAKLVNDIYVTFPGWLDEVLLAAGGLIAWYRNNQARVERIAEAPKSSAGAGPVLKMLLAIVLIPAVIGGAAVTTSCSRTVYQEITGYVNEFLPIAEAVANLIIGTEAPGVAAQAQAVETQVNNDLQLVETTASEITTENYANKRQAILNLTADAKSQLRAYLTALHVSNPSSVAKATALVGLGVAVIDEIVNALPATAPSPKEVMAFKGKVGNVRTNYKHEFNRIVSTKTGDARVDAVLARTPKFHKLLWVKY